MRSKTFRHEWHQPLEIAELTNSLNHFRVLHSFKVFLKLTRECGTQSLFEISQLIIEFFQFIFILALNYTSFLLICVWSARSFNLIGLPFFRGVLDRAGQLTRTIQELSIDHHLNDEGVPGFLDRVQVLEYIFLWWRRLILILTCRHCRVVCCIMAVFEEHIE